MSAIISGKVHSSITLKRLERAIKSNICGTTNWGFCTACGHKQNGVEADAEGYKCKACGMDKVSGAEAIAMRVV